MRENNKHSFLYVFLLGSKNGINVRWNGENRQEHNKSNFMNSNDLCNYYVLKWQIV